MVSPVTSRLLPALILFGLTLALTLGGILARPIESLSLFWPVNAVLAGVLLRNPRHSTPAGFGLIYLAMVIADLACGTAWQPALWFNLCNLGAIATVWYLVSRLPRQHRRLRTPHGTLCLFGACAAGAAVAASLACVMATRGSSNPCAPPGWPGSASSYPPACWYCRCCSPRPRRAP